jgi:hypothetical protein
MQPVQESSSLGELLQGQALERPHTTAPVFGERRTSYFDLNAQAN